MTFKFFCLTGDLRSIVIFSYMDDLAGSLTGGYKAS